jgi:hypothetical protein
MNKHSMLHSTGEHEEEIMNILVDSSLYQDMSSAERQRLLNYLVRSYFNPSQSEHGRALPKTIRFVPEM